MGSTPILGPKVFNRLAVGHYPTMLRARAARMAIEKRLGAEPALLRAFAGTLRSVRRVLNVRQGLMSTDEYVEVMIAGIRRLRQAGSRVVVRGPTGLEALLEDKNGQALPLLVSRVCEELRVPYLIVEELIRRNPDAMSLGGGMLNEYGHQRVANELDSLLAAEVDAVLAQRSEGGPGVLALPRRGSIRSLI